MKTTIDNNLRVFQVVDSLGHEWFCNLQDLNMVINENNLRSDYFKIYHFLNNKPKVATKKMLRDMFAAHKIEMLFDY
jgi:hypothetical protein